MIPSLEDQPDQPERRWAGPTRGQRLREKGRATKTKNLRSRMRFGEMFSVFFPPEESSLIALVVFDIAHGHAHKHLAKIPLIVFH